MTTTALGDAASQGGFARSRLTVYSNSTSRLGLEIGTSETRRALVGVAPVPAPARPTDAR